MIAAWMLFTLEISLLFFVAAWLAERALNAARRPVRWVWMTAMIATALLPLTALFAPVPQLAIPDMQAALKALPDTATLMTPKASRPPRSGTRPGVAANSVTDRASKAHAYPTVAANSVVDSAESRMAIQSTDSLRRDILPVEYTTVESKPSTARAAGIAVLPSAVASQLEVAPNSALQLLNASLLNAWLVIAGIGSLICLVAVARTMRQRGTWSGEYVDGTPVLVSHDVGPALIGVLQYSIVVPRWVLELEERARKLILAHEREHARSYDPILLALGVFLVVVAPWNVVNWFMLRRLRLAIEMDCDQRVLRAHPDARSYSALLLDVAERTLPSVMPQAALVEYGTSLETRIRAMISPSARHRALRVSGNLLAMGALVAVACVTPRPYASLPPAERVARLKSDLADAERALPADKGTAAENSKRNLTSPVATAPAYTIPFRNLTAVDSAAIQRAFRQRMVAAAETSVKSDPLAASFPYQPYGTMKGSLPDASTRMSQIQPSAEALRTASELLTNSLFEAIKNASPQSLGRWPRQDSTLVLIFDAAGDVVRHYTASRFRGDNSSSAMAIFQRLYFPGDLESIDKTGGAVLLRDDNNKELNVPLNVEWARLAKGAAVPRTRKEIMPSHEQMVAELHRSHPEIFDDKSSNPLIGTLLFDTNGKLLATAAVRSTEPRTWPDGQDNREFDRNIFRKAFGDLMNEGPIMQNGTTTYFDESTPHDGAPRVMYAFIARNSERNTGSGMAIKSGNTKMNITSVMRYRPPQGVIDQKELDARLMNAVASRVPQAFGKWARTDSAVYVVFDHNDQLFASTAGPISQHGELEYLIGMLKSRLPLPSPSGFEVAGFSTVLSDPSGAILDKPLQIVWGRVKQGTQLNELNSPLVTKLTPEGMLFGSSSRSSDPTSLDHGRIEAKVLSLVKTRSPEAFGAWPRADTALVFVFDSDDQLVMNGKGPIAQNAQLLYLASYINNRLMFIKEESIETVGIVNLTANGDGKPLNRPLQVVWGRLKPGAFFPVPKKK